MNSGELLMRRLTLAYLPFFGSSQVDVIEAAAAAGFRSVGLRIAERLPGDSFPHSVIGNRDRLRDIKRRLTDSNISLSNVCGRSLVRETTADELAGLVEAAEELGATYILVNGHDPDEHRMTDNMVRLANLAAHAGVKIGVEFVPFHCIRNLSEALRIVKATRSANVGLVIDPLHLSRSGGHPDEVAAVPRELIFYGQLCDALAERPSSPEGCLVEARSGRLYPGEGALPLREFMRSLPAECEIEVEVLNVAHQSLPLPLRAARIRESFERFMTTL